MPRNGVEKGGMREKSVGTTDIYHFDLIDFLPNLRTTTLNIHIRKF